MSVDKHIFIVPLQTMTRKSFETYLKDRYDFLDYDFVLRNALQLWIDYLQDPDGEWYTNVEEEIHLDYGSQISKMAGRMVFRDGKNDATRDRRIDYKQKLVDTMVAEIGKHITVNYMMAKDSVKKRLSSESAQGMSFTEFTYQLVQGYDFLHLRKNYGCMLQMGGSDQWGNITAGIDLIRKKTGKEAYGFTVPLITDSTGKKLGKSEGNAIWLDKNKTSSYELYQFFLNVEDCMVIDYLKKYTFLSKEEIDKLAESTEKEPEKRLAHKTLAKEIVTFLHGEEAYEEALNITNSLFSGNIKNLSSKEIMQAFKGLEAYEINEAKNIIDLLVESSICSSKREAREFVQNGSIYINGEKTNDLETIIDKNVAIDNKYIIIRRGKKKYFMVAFND